MRRSLILIFALFLVAALAACDGGAQKPAEPKAPATDGAKAPAKAPDADAGAAKAPDKAPAKAPDKAPEKTADKAGGDGGGLLPSPDFKLNQPDLKAPEGDSKGNLLGGGAAEGEEKKPKLLDVDLKKGQ